MLVTFSSKSYGNVTMFGDVAHSLITMMGFTTDVPGAIRAEDVACALVNLEEKLALITQQQSENIVQEIDNEDESETDIQISLDVRAVPLIDLLKAAISAKNYVMWE
ncbi:hypothetical protein AYY19_04400 [Photobacterium aquimaris]|uniref:DUF1840 domain-containing protein n=1 Tax=Photobacterium aquimaris TaxID=512643 RepID=A0A2T3IGH1_9GAMM|nr:MULTISPECIES: DUF1840 domain-containing protein [Photobacterium]OBU16404.1 hypothetical protein AYY19_04400 [Photobacterium aquimaris]OBU21483.1 hypothetical protein AYY20_13970 [Photobacterium aquimaris]PSU26070.1 DUF1840 domain-containing protein [Photobacterium aquimaris]PSW02192.1 DUF1840 domain-containing protein [Photobacterium aquimaris]